MTVIKSSDVRQAQNLAHVGEGRMHKDFAGNLKIRDLGARGKMVLEWKFME
jgi:hypothetical protein